MLKPANDIYGGRDPRSVPVYGLTEAARYLDIPVSTLRAWTVGQDYLSHGKHKTFQPVIDIPDLSVNLLSFTNVCEAHLCNALRVSHGIPLQRIRRAIELLRDIFPLSRHPLIESELWTSGVDIFVDRLGSGDTIDLTAGGQSAIRECLKLYLRRVERDQEGVRKLFPFTRTQPSAETPKLVVLDPYVLAGRPVIVNTRIATSVVYERWAAGESTGELAEDYGRSMVEIEEALRCEQQPRQAA